MTDRHLRFHERSEEGGPQVHFAGEIQYLLQAEKRLFDAISGRTPLAEVLHQICDALNSEIGNMISLVALPHDDATGLAEIGKTAQLFGLHKFCSADVVGGKDEILGSLEMYCTDPRRPFLRDVVLIERATCLAAVAIQRHKEAGNQSCKTTLKRELLT
jgi:hypothetical protein